MLQAHTVSPGLLLSSPSAVPCWYPTSSNHLLSPAAQPNSQSPHPHSPVQLSGPGHHIDTSRHLVGLAVSAPEAPSSTVYTTHRHNKSPHCICIISIDSEALHVSSRTRGPVRACVRACARVRACVCECTKVIYVQPQAQLRGEHGRTRDGKRSGLSGTKGRELVF